MLSNPASSTVFASSTSWSTGHIGTAQVYCIRLTASVRPELTTHIE